jgi:hypothetical protein
MSVMAASRTANYVILTALQFDTRKLSGPVSFATSRHARYFGRI